MVKAITKVGAEADVVVADLVRPVIHDLVLALVLQELLGRCSVFQIAAAVGAIAGILNVELGKPAVQGKVADVRIGNAQVVAQGLVDSSAHFRQCGCADSRSERR